MISGKALIMAAALAGALAATGIAAAQAKGSFSLKIYEGCRFRDGAVVKSDDKSADVRFTYQVRRAGIYVYLSADKIKELKAVPRGPFPAAETADWKDYILGPAPGYYGLVSKGRSYVVRIDSYENQGKAASFWKLNCSWLALD